MPILWVKNSCQPSHRQDVHWLNPLPVAGLVKIRLQLENLRRCPEFVTGDMGHSEKNEEGLKTQKPANHGFTSFYYDLLSGTAEREGNEPPQYYIINQLFRYCKMFTTRIAQ